MIVTDCLIRSIELFGRLIKLIKLTTPLIALFIAPLIALLIALLIAPLTTP